ncbi:hypothetical protein LAZ67_15003314 [Cordylochernes scorpioides]|uniref:Integrase catalytic domain-containing protein n=1 Tax=Cordylochernes scorpioides TaxID=51811 RepID=A0ABY6LAH3_9ARAC|nr:hypothetical protein LAZ67_15003314 [Cordylochernes scorpioides]
MPKQTSKVTSKKLYFEISKLDDLKIELENVEPQNKGYLKVQLDNINKIKENIENYMIALVDSDEHESHIPMYKEANKDITELQSTLLNYLELKENINTKMEETKINLPKFSLPSFKGDLDQWLDFKTTFEDTIINNSSLNNIQKFKYLQSSLSGDAASIIKGFSLTPDTFDKAWLALNERYHCTRDLAYKYCNNILNVKYIKVTNSRNIIELIDTVKLNLRNLELLGINEEQLGNMLLTSFILKKIDSNMNKDFELSLKENTFPTLQDLLTLLEKHRKGLDHINGKIYQKEDNVRKTFKTYQKAQDIPSASLAQTVKRGGKRLMERNFSYQMDVLNGACGVGCDEAWWSLFAMVAMGHRRCWLAGQCQDFSMSLVCLFEPMDEDEMLRVAMVTSSVRGAASPRMASFRRLTRSSQWGCMLVRASAKYSFPASVILCMSLSSVILSTLNGSVVNPMWNVLGSRGSGCVMGFPHWDNKRQRQLGTCQEFAKLSLDDRIKFVRSKNLCINCLSVNHYANHCKITATCKVCNKKHHTTLHSYNYQRRQGPISTTEHQANTSEEQNQHQTVNHTVLSNNTSILETSIFLSTALIKVFNSNNDELMCRALIDSDKLNITQEHTKVKISGFNSSIQSQVNKIIKIKLSSIYDHLKFETKALIVKDLSDKIPNFYTHNPVWPHLNNLNLADPEFYIHRPIDIIIGADLYLDLIEPGLIKGPRDAPSAMNSKLGWIISGRSNMPNNTTSTSIQEIHVNHSSAELDDIVKKIWDAESIPTHKEELNTEELECENIFRTTTFRDENGRYVVSLPFKLNYNKINYQLGDSKSQALRRFLSLERRFHQNPVYSQHVREFMQEYLNLGHMEVINEIEPERPSHLVYYMPYHAVLRDQSTTTKLRVVFDASAKTSTGLSLNDLLYCGPKLQEDIFNILIKFRTYSIALTADIEKMYRQIRLNPADCCFQRILWRASPNEPIKEYQLAIVTYGTTSAPYLAIKTLKTLAHDEQEQFPQASKAILTNFYVDDMLSGANSVEEAKDLIIQLNQIMRRGGFHLRKWASNVPKVLEALPNEDKYDISMVPIEKDLTINLLGLIWNATKDVFQVKVQDTMDVKTKRQLLSVIAQFFDPLGIISPSIILLKILMQDAWKLQLDWDDYLPDYIVNLWAQFKKEIGYLSRIMIPRYLAIIPKEDEVRMQLHGFADASAKAYAAVCYLRCETQNDVKIQLLAAKTRVASLKAPTLPCLELCAAHLLSQLVDSIKLTLPFQIKETFLWTDSKITLCWIQSNPSKWKVYISNRVEKIQKTSRVDQWHHVPGVVNPADCASRGLMPSKLVDHYSWRNGPSWLTTFDSRILSNKASVVEESEIVQSYGELIQIHYSSAEDVKLHSLPDSITRFSSYSRMKRTLAWCLTFINNSRYPSNKFSGTLTTKEIRSSELKIIKVVQECYFSVEINALLSSKALPKTNKLLCLNPFIDQNGILRSHVTELIIRQCHQEHFHSSFNLTCSILRRTYWIINGRSFVKQILKNCVQCFKVNARPNTQLMGKLPSSRTTYIRSFARTGVDLAGPILTKPRLPRSRVKLKSYIALFVCFATKAIHLELVSDLSTGSFIAALRRFTSRRGTPSDIYSDNGTNFKGAAKFLNEQYALLHASVLQDYITYSEINWDFMPPHAPHFGGIWESNIKSVKMILKKVIRSSLLTFGELTTFLTQIEATLNQRPLTPLSEDHNDLEALTPAHFLSGPSTSNLPETDNQQANLSINLSARWKHIQELKKLFILRWKKEYVINLQKRGKWKSAKPNVKIGDLVLIMEQSISSSSWILGRVSKTFHGPDMLVRTVKLRTGKGLLRRPVNKVAVLPVQSDLTLTTGPAGSMESVVMKSNREFENRAAIIVALRAGRSPKEIVNFLKLPKTTIYRVKKQFDEADSNKEGIATRKKHSRRSDRVRGEEFVKNVKEKIDGNPGKSMRAIAKEMDVGSMTIVRTIHEDLGLKSYALRKGQLLTENMKNNRKGKAAALLNSLKHDSFGMLRFFFDEKNFEVDQKVNPRNDRWICKDPSEIPVVMHTKFPASVMVLGVISSEGDVMPPHFFEKGLRMNADTYINVLETVVKPWMDMVASGRKYVFQQDSAPAHKAKKTQSWLTLNVPSHWGPDIWPPNSPDCNPLDYYVWGVVERDVNKAPHTTIQSVKKAVHTVMTQMDKVIVAKACASFRTRLETVVANNGNYIE